MIGADRASIRYRSSRPDDGPIRTRLRELAARNGKSVNELLRVMIRERLEAAGREPASALAGFFGSVDAAPPPPTNEVVRRVMRERGC